MKKSFDERRNYSSLKLADNFLDNFEVLKAFKSNPREDTTVPNYFVYFKVFADICILNLCLWDDGVGLQFRHPKYLPNGIMHDPELKLDKTTKWREYKFKNKDQLTKAIRLASTYLTVIETAIKIGEVPKRKVSHSGEAYK